MRSPVPILFLVVAVGLTLFAFNSAFQEYQRHLTSIADVVGFGFMVSSVFLVVAVGAAVAAVRGAPLGSGGVAQFVISLALGVCWVLAMFLAMG
jgi:hypothetical protein